MHHKLDVVDVVRGKARALPLCARHPDDSPGVGSNAVELVDESDAGHVVALHLAVDGDALALDAADAEIGEAVGREMAGAGRLGVSKGEVLAGLRVGGGNWEERRRTTGALRGGREALQSSRRVREGRGRLPCPCSPAEDENGSVKDAERALHLNGEVDVAGSVDDVDLAVLPAAVRGGGLRMRGVPRFSGVSEG